MTGSARKFEKIAFVASEVPQALDARERLLARYGNTDPKQADVIVALGGDGLMLQTLRMHLKDAIPIYGMNSGSVGFLTNEYSEKDLLVRMARVEIKIMKHLAMT